MSERRGKAYPRPIPPCHLPFVFAPLLPCPPLAYPGISSSSRLSAPPRDHG